MRIARSRGATQALSNKNLIIICIACTAAMFDGTHGLRGKRQSFQRLPCSSPPYPADSVRPQLPHPHQTAKKCSATEDCCRNPGGDRRPSSTVKYCSATGLLPNRQRGERPGVNGLPFSHRRKETPVFNKLQLLVNRRLRQNRLRGPS